MAAAYGTIYLLAGLAGLFLIHQHGRGYGGEYWRRPDIQAAVSYVRSRPDDLIISNDDTAIHFFTRRYAYFFPIGARLDFAAEIGGVPVIFVYWINPALARFAAKYSAAGLDAFAEESARVLNLRLVLSGPDVSVFRTR
ncbi:MAG: hypothetical protein ABSA30_11530 [Candidatus Aminicenantales bacterium]